MNELKNSILPNKLSINEIVATSYKKRNGFNQAQQEEKIKLLIDVLTTEEYIQFDEETLASNRPSTNSETRTPEGGSM